MVKALDDVSFSCEKGTVYGIVGPNGSGKTTCLRLIAGIIHPTSGQISVEGISLNTDFDKVREKVGYVSSTAQPYERLTPKEILMFSGRLAGLGKNLESRIEFIINDLGISDFQNRFCGTLSSGMRQRVEIGRALVHNPNVLIFDEPLTGLDIVARRNLIDQFKQLKNSEKILLFSTHIPEELERLCDNILILNRGKLVEQGAVQELKDKYSTNNLENMLLTIIIGGGVKT